MSLMLLNLMFFVTVVVVFDAAVAVAADKEVTVDTMN